MTVLRKVVILGLLLSFMSPIALSVSAAELTAQEKVEFMKSSTSTCIAKNNASRQLTSAQKDGVRNYCVCHAGVMGSIVTREEMRAVVQGKVPQSFQAKVVEARKQCIDALLQ